VSIQATLEQRKVHLKSGDGRQLQRGECEAKRGVTCDFVVVPFDYLLFYNEGRWIEVPLTPNLLLKRDMEVNDGTRPSVE
jgi:hypothetical protein